LLTHPTLDLLHQLGLNGMAKAFGEIEASAEATTLTHPEWLGLLLDQEVSYRRDRRLLARLRYARLRRPPLKKRTTGLPTGSLRLPDAWFCIYHAIPRTIARKPLTRYGAT
jgi:hypothetical protein